MTYARTIIGDLRDKRLWPIVGLLLAAIVAVPILLSGGSSSSTPVAPPAPAPLTGAAPPKGVPAVVAMNTAPSHARITGKSRNPFAQHQANKSAASPGSGNGAGASSTGSTTTTPSGSSSSSSSSTTSTTSTTGAGSTTTTTPTTTTTTPTTPSAPAGPEMLAADESYHVAISLTNAAGGVNAIDPVKRLTVLPSEHSAQLVELGVLKGGQRVLFLVEPGTTVSGPGTCTPGPVNCEILSLKPNQIEKISSSSSGGGQIVSLSSNTRVGDAAPAPVNFAVTSLGPQAHDTVSAAAQARQEESAAGHVLVKESKAGALSLFHYDPSIGAVVDLRNVSVGGN